MKKFMKKMSAFLLTAAMATAMCMPAFATSTAGGTVTEVTAGSKANVTVGVSQATGDAEDGYANGGDNLLLYQVVKIEYKDGNDLTYAFSEMFQEFLTADGRTLDPKGYGELGDDMDAIKELLGAFTAYIKGQETTPEPYRTGTTDTDGTYTFANVDMGQYIVIGDGASTGAKIYQTVTAEVEPTINDENKYVLNSDYTVAMKTSTPSVGKDIEDGTVTDNTIGYTKPDDGSDKHDSHQGTSEIGKEISYKLTVKIPTYPEGATNKTFYLGDILSKGLDLNGESIVVTGFATAEDTTGTPLTKDTDYAVVIKDVFSEEKPEEKTGTALYVDFDFDKIAIYDHVEIQYKASLNADAEVGTIVGNKNHVDLIYSNDPFNGNTWKPGSPEEERPEPGKPGYGDDKDMEIVYTYAFVIDKFEEKQEDEKLSDAVFELYREYDAATKTYSDPVKEKDAAGTETTVTLTTDANGAALYKGIQKGTYYLKETVAPTGYNLMDEPVVIVIDGTTVPYTTTVDQTVTHYTYTAEATAEGQAKINGDLVWINAEGNIATGKQPEGFDAAYVDADKTTTTVEQVIEINKDMEGANGYYKAGVSNNTGAQLPSTGGIGTTIFTLVGLVLMLGAAIVLIARRRTSGRE